MTKVTGISGLISVAWPSKAIIASRIAARSTIAGTPVKSCKITRSTLKGTTPFGLLASQLINEITSSVVISSPIWRATLSNNTRIE